MDREKRIFPRKMKVIAKGIEIYGSGIFEYSVRSEDIRIIVILDQAYYVPGLTNYLRIIYPQVVCTKKGYTGTSIAL